MNIYVVVGYIVKHNLNNVHYLRVAIYLSVQCVILIATLSYNMKTSLLKITVYTHYLGVKISNYTLKLSKNL